MAVRGIEEKRVGVVKILVALLPDSAGLIEALLKKRRGKHVYEVHFSLFCFLDFVEDIDADDDFRRRVPSLVKEYLINVRTEAAYAAWMAGQFLGDHWAPEEALPVLTCVAMRAKSPIERKAAVSGLHCLLKYFTRRSSERRTIMGILNYLADKDRSPAVRHFSSFVVSEERERRRGPEGTGRGPEGKGPEGTVSETA